MTDMRTNEELTATTAAGLRWISFARVGTELLLLGSMVILARAMPPSAFGMYAIVVIAQELAITVPSEGVGSALVQRATIARDHLQGGFALSLFAGTVLTALTLVLAFVLVRPVFGAPTASLVLLATPWFLLGSILALPTAVLRRRLDFRRLSMLDLVQSGVRSATSVLLALVAGLDAPALVLGGVAGLVAVVALALVFAPVPFPRLRLQAMRDLLPYGGPASLASLCWTGFRNGDYAIIGARLGAAQAGFYWRGYQLAVEYQRKVSVVMTQVAFPVLSRTTGVEEMFALRRRMVRLLTVMLFPLLTTLVVVAPVLIPWLFGPAWEPAVVPTQILAGGGAATIVIDAVGSVLMAAGRTRALLGYGVAHFAVYACAVFFTTAYGLAAVSIAATATHGLFLVVAYRILLRDRPEPTFRFLWEDLSAATVSCLALAAVAIPVDLSMSVAGTAAPVRLIAVAVAGAAAYLGALRILFPDAAQDLLALVRRIVPTSVFKAGRRIAVPAGRSTG